MSAHDAHGSAAPSRHPAVGHEVPWTILTATATVLLILTWLTVWVRYHVDIPRVNLLIAMGIATVKAALVILYFMHMRWDRPFNIVVLVSSLLFAFLFISFSLTDSVAYRSEIIPPASKDYAPKMEAAQQRTP